MFKLVLNMATSNLLYRWTISQSAFSTESYKTSQHFRILERQMYL